MTNEERLDEIERTQREIWKSLARLTAITDEMDRRLEHGMNGDGRLRVSDE